MIGALIIVFLYLLIALWIITMTYKHSLAISEFSVKRWLTGSSHSVGVFKGLLCAAVIFGGLMIVGYMEAGL